MWRVKLPQILLFSVSIVGFSTASVLAQIVPDNTLGNESSTVTPNITIKDTPADLIEGGAIRDNNLFHSFSEFNIGDGNAVYFANPDGIANILTRVTGSNSSGIFGTVGVNGAANLFLLNPNGIVFGENAALDINGSFFATTAESFLDEDDNQFSAVESSTPPLLNINLAPGLQMGSSSGDITVEGNGHSLTGGVLFPLNSNTASGLQVKTGQTLGLIAEEIKLNGGILKMPGGNIELASIEQGNVYFDADADSWRLNTSQVARFGDIKLKDRALVDTSGILTGNIRLQGKNISLEDASAAIIQNFGTGISGEIIVNATDSVTLSGSVRTSPDISTPQGNITGVASSRLTTETLGTGKSGALKISGNNLLLDDGSSISSRSFSNAETGNLELKFTESINVNGASLLNPLVPTSLGTLIFSSGNSGKINIVARKIDLNESGTISSLNFGSGRGGEINVRAEELKFDSMNSISGNPSSLGSTLYRTGDSGDITVNASRISILNGGKISTSTLAQGNAGKITVNSSEYIEISGVIPGGLESSISSDGEVLAPNLRQFLGIPDVPSGNSGNIVLNTPQLMVSNGGAVAVNNGGLGNSGSLKIESDRILLENNASVTAFSASGQGGNIELNINDSLLLRNASSITAENAGTFADSESNVDGGNISIDADTITLLKKSQINANALEGNGGNINITAQGLFVSADSQITASSEFGLDGNIEIENINGNRPIELDRLPENLVDATQQIARRCGGDNNFTIAGKGGLPENPSQNLRGQIVWQDLRIPIINHNNASLQSSSNDNLPEFILVEADNWKINRQGKIELLARSNSNSHLEHNSPNCRETAKNRDFGD